MTPNRKGMLRYVGGLDLIHVAFSIYVRRDVLALPAIGLRLTVSFLNLM